MSKPGEEPCHLTDRPFEETLTCVQFLAAMVRGLPFHPLDFVLFSAMVTLGGVGLRAYQEQSRRV